MNIAKIYTTAAAVTTGEKTSFDIQAEVNKGRTANANNVGTVQVVGASTVTVEGSVDNTNFMPIAASLTSAAGATLALMPFMRVNVTVASGSGLTVYIVW